MHSYKEYLLNNINSHKSLIGDISSMTAKSISTSLVCYYLINYKNKGLDGWDTEKTCNSFDKWRKNGGTLCTDDILISNNTLKYSVNFMEVERNVIDYFTSHSFIGADKSLDDLIQMLKYINTDTELLYNEIELLDSINTIKNTRALIILLTSIIEPISVKLGSKGTNEHIKYIKGKLITADDICKAFLSKTIIYSSFTDNDTINNILLPNRHIVFHRGVMKYNEPDKTYHILINMIFYIINYYYISYKIIKTSDKV